MIKKILNTFTSKPEKLIFEKSENEKDEKPKSDTDWRSIYIATFVALISSIQGFSIIPILWPYIKFINPEISEIANGAFQGASALGNAVASLFSGYLVNKTSNTKPALIISRILAICSTFIYFGIELNSTTAIYLMIAYQLLMGISFGFGNVYRTHIAMATKESERSKGYGLSNLSYSLGTIIGPFLPNDKILQQQKLSAVSINPSISLKEVDDKIEKVENIKYDKIAVFVLIYTKCVHETIMLILFSITMPYAMSIFAWNSQQLIFYQSLFMAPMGICSVIFSLIYIRFKLVKKIPERIALMIAIGLFVLFFVATFPWPFISQKIPYEHEKNGTTFFKQSEAEAALKLLNTSNMKLVGCKISYKWCEKTPRINLAIFGTSIVFFLGIGIPLLSINLDILYSKVLGPIKQGVLQGIFLSCGEIINIFGPIIVT
uniref:Major facilitator superfamily (MFS) profile domain-containing protein n=1 Tax=Panagrolaimus sp. ES5 TaxID=591445 RepID=A0AC34GVG6_9BILA